MKRKQEYFMCILTKRSFKKLFFMSIDIFFLLIYILYLQLSNKRKLKIKVFFKKRKVKIMETVFTADPAQLLIAAAAGILSIMPILTKTD